VLHAEDLMSRLPRRLCRILGPGDGQGVALADAPRVGDYTLAPQAGDEKDRPHQAWDEG
jgi:hypothetical protein